MFICTRAWGAIEITQCVYPLLLYAEEFNPSKDVFPVHQACHLVVNKCLRNKEKFPVRAFTSLTIKTYMAQSEQSGAAAIVLIIEKSIKTQEN